MIDDRDDLRYRTPPSNIEAEQALLGAILVQPRAFDRVADFLKPAHFYEGVHGRIFTAIATLIGRGQPANPVTLKNLFDQDGALAEIGGAQYLARLAASVVTIINAEEYGRIIRDAAIAREVIAAGEAMINAAYGVGAEKGAQQLVDEAEGSLWNIRTAAIDNRTDSQRLSVFAAEAVQQAEERFKHGGVLGVPTGFLDLDDLLGGMVPSDLVVLGGRPSMGKTALLTGIIWNAGQRGHPGYLASLEMSGAQVALRVLSNKAGVSSQKVRTGKIDQTDLDRLAMAAIEDVRDIPIEIDQTGGLTLTALRARIRRFLQHAAKLPGARVGPDGKPLKPIIGVDYLQLMGTEGRRSDNRTEDVSQLSRGLKAMAKDFDVAIVACSQLSRAVEARDNKRPILADLRESGSIEQDADVVMFVFREEYYLARAEPVRRHDENESAYNSRFEQWADNLARVKNLAEVLIPKNRHGPTGNVKLHFNHEATWFNNLVRDPP